MSGPCTDCGGPDYLTLEARIAELEAENASMADDFCSMTGAYERAEQAEAELAAVGSDLQDEAEYNITLRERAEQAKAERDVAIELVTMARQTFDADGNGTRFLSEIREDVLKDVRRLAERRKP